MKAPKVDERYEECAFADIPADIRWKPAPATRHQCPWRTFFTIGNCYKLIRVLDTGAVTYFKLKDTGTVTPKDKLDADDEPARPRQPQLSVGTHVWFVDGNRWFELEVVEKSGSKGRRVTFKSVTGWDDKREVEWGLGTLLEFPTHSPLFARLRRINTRRP